MWCLETIVALNEAAAKRARNGESELLAYADVGIRSHSPKQFDELRVVKPKEKKKEVA